MKSLFIPAVGQTHDLLALLYSVGRCYDFLPGLLLITLPEMNFFQIHFKTNLLCFQMGHPANPRAAHVSAFAAAHEQEESRPGD